MASQEGFKNFAARLANVNSPLFNPRFPPEGAVHQVLPGSLCDVQVANGLLDGKATCSAPRTSNVQMEMKFKQGALVDSFKIYAPDSSGTVLSEATFNDGMLDGKQNIYSADTHKLIRVVPWNKGRLDGTEEGFDPSTETQVLRVTYSSGVYDGPLTSYAADGRQISYHVNMVGGRKDGLEEAFYPQNGKPATRAQYTHGTLNGTVKRWNAEGEVVFFKDYQNGEEMPVSDAITSCANEHVKSLANVNGIGDDEMRAFEAQCREHMETTLGTTVAQATAPSAQAQNTDACVDKWTSAFRKEAGDDATINADQISEWRSTCISGKLPG